MRLLVPRLDQRLHKNRRQPIFADELVFNIQRMRECFVKSTLPRPSAKVVAAWNDVPNITVDSLFIAMKTDLVFLRAPPPMPTGFAPDMDSLTSTNPSSNSSQDCDADYWRLVDNTTSSTLDEVVLQDPEGPATEEEDSTSGCIYPDQPMDQQINEEYSLRPTDGGSLSSDQDSISSSGGCSPIPVGFESMVNQWLLDYRTRGLDLFVEALIAFGVVSVETALLASRIARAIVRIVSKLSCTEGKNLEQTFRSSALTAFKKYWEVNDTSMDVPSMQMNTVPPTPYGINIATLMGSLFNEKISTSKDIHLCLALLLEGEKRFDRLCAMHAVLVQANDKLCKNRNLPGLIQFRDGITAIGEESREYIWATTPSSKMIINDIVVLIERWRVSQSHKREQCRMSFQAGKHTIRNSAVGPRLRRPTTCLVVLGV